MNILERYPGLKKNVIFKNADDRNIIKYITDKDFRVYNFSPGEEICSPDKKLNSIGIVTDGVATVSSSDGNKGVLLRTISAGAIFGVSTLYSEDSPFPTKIYAKSSCSILLIDNSAMHMLIENDVGAMRGLMTFLSNRIVYLNKKINSFTAGSAERRLSLFLSDNECDGVYSADVSLSAIADMLDIGRASLYRAFDKLEDDGFIEKHDKTIILKDKKSMLEKYFH